MYAAKAAVVHSSVCSSVRTRVRACVRVHAYSTEVFKCATVSPHCPQKPPFKVAILPEADAE